MDPVASREISLHLGVTEGGCVEATSAPCLGDCRKAYVYVSANSRNEKGGLHTSA